MIAYSAEAEPARAYLLRAYNDIDIFVEDASCQNMYVRLFSRMLEGQARITQVFPLHSRQNVVAKCAADQLERARRRLYVIDADQDLLLGQPSPALHHLYRLSVYCSENLLLSEHAVVTLATEGSTNASWQSLAAALNLRSLLETSTSILLPLFVVYGVVAKLDLPIETVKYSVVRLITDPTDAESLSVSLVNARILSLIRAILGHVSRDEYRLTRDALLGRLNTLQGDPSDYISGKTYLLPLIRLHLHKKASVNDSLSGLKVRLAQHCELSIDAGLQASLLNASRT